MELINNKWKTKMTVKKKCRSLAEVNKLLQHLYHEGICTHWKVYEAIPYFIVEYDMEIQIEETEEE